MLDDQSLGDAYLRVACHPMFQPNKIWNKEYMKWRINM